MQKKKDHTDREHGIVQKELMNGRAAGEMTDARKEARSSPRAANLIGTTTRTREAMGAKGKARAKARARVKPDTATTAESRGTSRVNCPYKWANSIDEEDDQVIIVGERA